MRSKRAFILTTSVFLIVFSALLFSLGFLKHSQSIESIFSQNFALKKSSFVLDNIFSQAARLLGTEVNIENTASNTVVSFSDSMPSMVSKQSLSEFKEFVEKYSSLNNSQISLDFSKLADGKTELIFNNGLEYDFNYSENNVVEVFSKSMQGSFSRIDLDINSTASMIDFNAWNWQPSGDLEINLTYKDSAVTVKASGRIDSSALNSYVFNYSNNALHVEAGNIDGRKALRIWQETPIQAKIKSKFFIPLQKNLKYYYDADLNYSQLGLHYNAKLTPLNIE